MAKMHNTHEGHGRELWVQTAAKADIQLHTRVML